MMSQREVENAFLEAIYLHWMVKDIEIVVKWFLKKILTQNIDASKVYTDSDHQVQNLIASYI